MLQPCAWTVEPGLELPLHRERLCEFMRELSALYSYVGRAAMRGTLDLTLRKMPEQLGATLERLTV